MSTLRVGVDVGGTFTDFLVLDEASGQVEVVKIPTSRPDQSVAFLEGIRARVTDMAALSVVTHGTTVGTNALLERKGARVGVITTRGLRDVLEMRRRDRPRSWGLRGDFVPVVPRGLRLEVTERTLADGTIREGVDVEAVCAAAAQLREAQCDVVVVLFAHAYANPANEQRALDAIRAMWPEVYLSASHQIAPEIREFERFSTTALNGFLQPEITRYLARLTDALAREGFGGEFLVIQSNGGVMSVDTATRLPVRTALSGPAAGVIAAAALGQAAGFADLITGDMGGTSFDVALVREGKSVLTAQSAVDFGLVIRSPMIEMTTIGAGGGSIAWIDSGGLLNIGPQSAGSDPGPVAWGRGNREPTVTDAHVVLGRIDPMRPIGGALQQLDQAAAAAAIDAQIGAPLGLSTGQAAEAILRVANARMASAIRLVSVERGYDPRKFAFMPFGGGGALHACALMEEVGIGYALVPRYPGVTSAIGCVMADMRQDFVQTLNQRLDQLDEQEPARCLRGHVATGMRVLAESPGPLIGYRVELVVDMIWQGQTHPIAVPLPVTGDPQQPDSLTVPGHDQIAGAFDRVWQATYGRGLSDGIRRVVNVRTAVTGLRQKFDPAWLAPAGGTVQGALRGRRPVFLAGEWRDTAAYDRLALPVGAELSGPVVLEQPDTTILIEPGAVARVDAIGNVVIGRPESM